ncbi:MAG TPA: cytochrome c biogenesis protein CcdA [Bacilli bacterium]
MHVNVWIAFWAGMASFISPCCLPLYPSYLSYITGISVSQLKSSTRPGKVRVQTAVHTLFFILGFSIVFFTLGFGAGALGDIFKAYDDLIRRISAIFIVLMGLFLLGVFQPQLLMKEKKLNLQKWKPAGYLGSTVIGIGFAAGWSPCLGPILAAIISLALTEPNTWFPLITAYTLGFAIPFFVLSFYIGSAKWIVRYSRRVMQIGGALMIVMGVLLYTDRLGEITKYLNNVTPDWLKF